MAPRIGPSKNTSSNGTRSNGTTSMREDRAKGAQIRREIAESKKGYAVRSASTGQYVQIEKK